MVVSGLGSEDIREMSITSEVIKVQVRGLLMGQRVENIQWYVPTGAAFLTAEAAGVAEAYWNDIKTLWRGFHVASPADTTLSVFVSEPGSDGAYGEYAIPTGEQQGTRDATGAGQLLPPTNSVGVRLTVASRVTRPGQKRFWGVWEGDNEYGVLQPALYAAADALAVKFSDNITLGSPVATGVLIPVIVHNDPITGEYVSRQEVVGHAVSTYISTQNSRKFGRGA